MIARVQYNDIDGTISADVADWYNNSLQIFLEKTFPEFDAERFSCRGCSAFLGGENRIFVSFICYDKETENFVKVTTENPWSYEEFFGIFKRLELVIGSDMGELPEAVNMKEFVLNNGGEEN